MGYTLDLEKTDEIIRVTVDGLLNNSIRVDILSEINNQFKLNNYHKAIVDLRGSEFNPSEPIEGAIDLTIHLNRIKMRFDTKLAFIYIDAEKHRKQFQKLAQQFSYNLQYFKNIEDAYSWLNEC